MRLRVDGVCEMASPKSNNRRSGRRPSWWKETLFDELRGLHGPDERAVGSICRACGTTVRDAQRNATRLARHILRCRATSLSRREQVWLDCSWTRKNKPRPCGDKQKRRLSTCSSAQSHTALDGCETDDDLWPVGTEASDVTSTAQYKRQRLQQSPADVERHRDDEEPSREKDTRLAVVRWATTHLIPFGAMQDDNFVDLVYGKCLGSVTDENRVPSPDVLSRQLMGIVHAELKADLQNRLASTDSRTSRHTMLLYSATCSNKCRTTWGALAVLVKIGAQVHYVDLISFESHSDTHVEETMLGVRGAFSSYGGMDCVASVATDLSEHAMAVAEKTCKEYPRISRVNDQVFSLQALLRAVSGSYGMSSIIEKINHAFKVLDEHPKLWNLARSKHNILSGTDGFTIALKDNSIAENTTLTEKTDPQVSRKPAIRSEACIRDNQSSVSRRVGVSVSTNPEKNSIIFKPDENVSFPKRFQPHNVDTDTANELFPFMHVEALTHLQIVLSELRRMLTSDQPFCELLQPFGVARCHEASIRPLQSKEFICAVKFFGELGDALTEFCQTWRATEMTGPKGMGLSRVYTAVQTLKNDMLNIVERVRKTNNSLLNDRCLDELVSIVEKSTHPLRSSSSLPPESLLNSDHVLAYVLNPAYCPSDISSLMPYVHDAVQRWLGHQADATAFIANDASSGSNASDATRGNCESVNENSLQVRILKQLGLYLQLDESTFGYGVNLRQKFEDDPASWWVLFARSSRVSELRDLAIRILRIPAAPLIASRTVGLQAWIDALTSSELRDGRVKCLLFCHQNLRLQFSSPNSRRKQHSVPSLSRSRVESFLADVRLPRSNTPHDSSVPKM